MANHSTVITDTAQLVDWVAAGCIINDLWDRRLDQQVERTQQRPLASGAISVGTAFLCLGILGLIGIGILWQLPVTAVYVGLAAIPLVILYPLAKRVTWFPQFVLGLTFSWGVPLGWAAATGALPDAAILCIYAGCVAWVFGYDPIYNASAQVFRFQQTGILPHAASLCWGRHATGR